MSDQSRQRGTVFLKVPVHRLQAKKNHKESFHTWQENNFVLIPQAHAACSLFSRGTYGRYVKASPLRPAGFLQLPMMNNLMCVSPGNCTSSLPLSKPQG